MLYVSAHENNTGLIFVIQTDKLINKRLRTAFTKKLFSADLLFLFQSGRKAASFLKVHNISVDLLGFFGVVNVLVLAVKDGSELFFKYILSHDNI